MPSSELLVTLPIANTHITTPLCSPGIDVLPYVMGIELAAIRLDYHDQITGWVYWAVFGF